MAVFSFKAKNLAGQVIEGRREAADRFDLANALRKEGYFLISRKEEKAESSFLKLSSIFGRVSIQEKMVFARNLAVMVGAGVSMIRGLDVLSRQSDNKNWKKTLENMGQIIKQGSSLSQSMENYPGVFSPLFRSMVKSGEASGKLEEALRLVANQLEREYELKRKVRGALVYPAVIIIAMVIIGILMMVYVVPTLVSTFEELGVELPATTSIIIGISGFLTGHWFLSSVLGVVIAAIFLLLTRSAPGKKFLSAFFLKLPVISGIVKKVNAARVSRTLSSLISSGVEIVEALQVTEDVVQNPRFKKVLNSARGEIQKGNPVSRVFIENDDLFPLLVGEMMAVGEETGKFSDMLLRVASFYEESVAESTKALSTVIEPVLMIIIGVFVGFFAVSMIQPLYSISGGL
ncbi:MAG: type II secretion system F family protein [Candidatus Niyogibacteria bacterium]|nr:MAG: type II secretion system F family protein [Candidatus Niyogibacteria bacterium]